MIFRKSTEDMMEGILEGVKASMSLCSPGTAAEMSFDGPRAVRRAERRSG